MGGCTKPCGAARSESEAIPCSFPAQWLEEGRRRQADRSTHPSFLISFRKRSNRQIALESFATLNGP